MKKDIHPEYREVVFKDVLTNKGFVTRSTVATKKTIVWEDGKEYPLVTLDVSSYSHPFFTGQDRFVERDGRVDTFIRKFAGKGKYKPQTQKGKKK